MGYLGRKVYITAFERPASCKTGVGGVGEDMNLVLFPVKLRLSLLLPFRLFFSFTQCKCLPIKDSYRNTVMCCNIHVFFNGEVIYSTHTCRRYELGLDNLSVLDLLNRYWSLVSSHVFRRCIRWNDWDSDTCGHFQTSTKCGSKGDHCDGVWWFSCGVCIHRSKCRKPALKAVIESTLITKGPEYRYRPVIIQDLLNVLKFITAWIFFKSTFPEMFYTNRRS